MGVILGPILWYAVRRYDAALLIFDIAIVPTSIRVLPQ